MATSSEIEGAGMPAGRTIEIEVMGPTTSPAAGAEISFRINGAPAGRVTVGSIGNKPVFLELSDAHATVELGVSLALLYVSRGWDSLIPTIWPAVLLIYIELMLLTAVALLFSSFSSPALSALLTFLVFIIGHFSTDLKSLATSMGTAPARWFFGALYYLLPNLSNFSYITPAAHGVRPPLALAITSIVYAVLYIAIILAAATLVLNRRNFK